MAETTKEPRPEVTPDQPNGTPEFDEERLGGFERLCEIAENCNYYALDEEGEAQRFYLRGMSYDTAETAVSFRNFIYQNARDSKKSRYIFEDDGTPIEGARTIEQYYVALTKLEKDVSFKFNDGGSDDARQLKSLLSVGLIAGLYRPDNWDGEKPKKHKKETEEGYMFRRAIRTLHNVAYAPDTRLTDSVRNLFHRYSDADKVDEYLELASNPELSDLRTGQYEIKVKATAIWLLELLSDSHFSATEFKEDYYQAIRQGENRKSSDPEDIDDEQVTFDEVEWTILPPGTLEEMIEAGEGDPGNSERFVDPARMIWLARIAMNWGSDAYVAVGTIAGHGEHSYRVAVLPTQHAEVGAIEHAVAENPSSGNAVFVWRAEKGIRQTEEGLLASISWRQVFRRTKGEAKGYGARRILHTSTLDSKVHDYLTRPEDQLDDPRYKT